MVREHPSHSPRNQAYLTLCAIARDEDDYIHEWVSFHLAVGVDRVVVVEHARKPRLAQVLGSFIDHGVVDLYRYTSPTKPQREVYNRVLSRYRRSTRWLGFFDIDEFVFPSTHQSLPEVLSRYEGYAGLVANWVCFGSGGRVEKTEGWVTETYTDRGPLDHVVELPQYRVPRSEDAIPQFRQMNTHVKSFVDPRQTLHFRTAHHFKYRPGQWAVDENFQRVDEPFSSHVSVGQIRVNHYWSKSLYELDEKITRGMVSQHGTRKDSRYNREAALQREAASRGVPDTEILRLVPAAKTLARQFPVEPPAHPRSIRRIRYRPADWWVDIGRVFFSRLRASRRLGHELLQPRGRKTG